VAHWGCDDSDGDVVALLGYGGSVGDVVAQSAMTRLQRSKSGFVPVIPHSLLRADRKSWLNNINKISGCEVSFPEQKKNVLYRAVLLGQAKKGSSHKLFCNYVP
jgi:hypothetical protein